MLRNLSDAGDGQIPMIKAFNVNNRTIYGIIFILLLHAIICMRESEGVQLKQGFAPMEVVARFADFISFFLNIR